jgi:hypothetical protein
MAYHMSAFSVEYRIFLKGHLFNEIFAIVGVLFSYFFKYEFIDTSGSLYFVCYNHHMHTELREKQKNIYFDLDVLFQKWNIQFGH